MRIAIVCPYSIDEPGGVQAQAIGLVEEIRAIGHEAWLVAPGTKGPSESKLIGRSVRVRANGSIAPIALHPAAVGKTRRAVRGADVVHIHEPLMFLTSPAAYLGTDAPAVGTFHADPSTRVRAFYRLAGPALRKVFSRLQAVTAVSEAAASAVGHLVGELSLIPNAIDVEAFALPGERRPNRVAFLGRDEPRKGLDVLLAAWPIVRAAVNDAELVVLGLDRGGQDNGIRYLGTTVGLEKRRQLTQAGIYCAPNLGGESFGVTLLEAMAAGCALVVSDLEPFRQVAGSLARYAAVADPQSLANQLIEALRDRRGSERQGKAARQAAAAYDWRHVMPRYVELYERVRR